jgi:dihydrofolate reductase
MRKLVLQMGVSVDGYVAGGPQDAGDEESVESGEHPEVTARKLELMRGVGLHMMGRVTYEEMAAYWPTSSHVYAAVMNDIPKVVFSKTLTSADWPVTRIASGDLTEEVDRLKAEPGGDIIAYGGASFAQALSRHGVVDEYRLFVNPTALGSGQPMFKDLAAPLHLELVESTSFPDGTIITTYQPARKALA